ncbi:MAG: hypothetical protein SGBAC_010092 [Bacillariaceae sp.]
MSHNGHDNENDSNSITYFDRMRKQSVGHTPFTIYDSTTSALADVSNTINTTVGSSPTLPSSDSNEENKFGWNMSPSTSAPRSRQATQTSKVSNSKSSSSIGRSAGASSSPLRNNWEARGYNVDANPSVSSCRSGQLGRLRNPRAEGLFSAPTPQMAVRKVCSPKEKSKYYKAPFDVVRELNERVTKLSEIVMAQSQEMAQLKENNDDLSSRVEHLEEQVAAASKPSRRNRMCFAKKKAATTSSHRMNLRRRNNKKSGLIDFSD